MELFLLGVCATLFFVCVCIVCLVQYLGDKFNDVMVELHKLTGKIK